MYKQQDAFPTVQGIGGRDDLSVDFSISSVRIENPSGMWLYLQQASRFIAPYTVASMVTIPTPTKTLVIQYVAAPIGGVASVLAGGPLRITMYEDEAPENVGVDYSLVPTLQTLDADIITLTAAIDGLNGGTSRAAAAGNLQAWALPAAGGGLVPVIAAPPAGQSIYITHVTITWSQLNAGMIAAGDYYVFNLQSDVTGTLHIIGGVDRYHAIQDIDFSNPVQVDVGEGLEAVFVQVFAGAAGEMIDVMVQYYVA